MDSLIAAAGLLLVGAITPGPNNLVILREAAQRGWRGALPAGLGIVTGGVALLLAAAAGVSSLAGSWRRLLGLGAALLLVALGGALLRASFRPAAAASPALPGGRLGSYTSLFLFQFANPKSWMLVAALTASIAPGPGFGRALAQLVGLFVLVPVVCLALWSAAGTLAHGVLERPRARAWLDRTTGVLLIGFALLLLLGGFHV